MRILMLTWHYPPALGGAERMAARLVSALASRGHRIEIWTARRSDAPAFEEPSPTVTIRRMFRGVPFGPLFGVSVFLQSAWRLWREHRRFDVIHSHQASWGALGALWIRRRIRKPVIVRVASSGPMNDIRLIRERKGGGLAIRLLGRADRVIALCRAARAEIARYGEIALDRIEIVPNGVDLSEFEVPAREEAEPGTLLYVGRLHPIKGVDLLIRAFGHVRKTHPETRLVILGDGEARGDLEALAAELGLSRGAEPEGDAAVVFLGLKDDPLPFYRRAGLVVLPSRTEGMSNVLVEAMALGKGVVATAVGGNVDLIDPEDRRSTGSESEKNRAFLGTNGVLVPPENPEALAEGIRMLLDDAERARALGASARRFAERNCTLQAVAERYLQVYQEQIRAVGSREQVERG